MSKESLLVTVSFVIVMVVFYLARPNTDITPEQYDKGKIACSDSGVESYYKDGVSIVFYCYNGDIVRVE